MILDPLKRLVSLALQAGLAVLLICIALLLPKRRTKLVWGTTPIINNKYWSAAVAQAGWESVTLMDGFYEAINKRGDFDIVLDELVPSWIRPRILRRVLARCIGFLFILRHARVLHLPAHGGPLAPFAFWFVEGWLLRLAGIRTVVIPYGSDVWMYSKVFDTSTRHGLLSCYPELGRQESSISRRLRYWERYGDVVISGFIVDGRGYWHVTVHNILCIDLALWKCKGNYSSADGTSGQVTIVHAPNHRAYKGTEFLEKAIDELRAEGLNVRLLLLERVQNDVLRDALQNADIVADQFINTGYGLAAVEAMASGLPVVGNLESEARTLLFRRYSFLDECPVVSSSPEALRDTLRVLVTQPALRRTLGLAGRRYVEKYHGFDAAQYLFGSIYESFFGTKAVDLLNLFHPLKSAFNRRLPKVAHPLISSHLPPDFQANAE